MFINVHLHIHRTAFDNYINKRLRTIIYIYTNVDISHFLPCVYTLYTDYPSADNSTYFSVVFYNCISSIKKTTTIYSN